METEQREAPTTWFALMKLGVVFLLAFNAGLSFAAFGAALPDLQYVTSSSAQAASTVFSVMGACILFGATLAGPLFDRVRGLWVMGVLTLIQAACLAPLGLSNSLTAVLAMTGGTILSNSAIFTGCQALSLRLLPQYGRSAIQGVGLVHTAAMALSPMVLAPFLGDYRNVTHGNDSDDAPVITGNNTTGTPFVKVEWGFLALAVAGLLTAVPCFGIQLWEYVSDNRGVSTRGPSREELSAARNRRQRYSGFAWRSCHWSIALIVTGIILFNALSGVKFVLLSSYLYTFLSTYLMWDTQQAALLLSCFQIVRFAGSAAAVVLAHYIKPLHFLIFDVCVLAIDSLVMWFAMHAGSWVTWVCILASALGSSNIAATVGTLAAESFPEAASTMVGLCYGTAGLAQIVFPPLIVVCLESYGDVAFPAILFVSTAVAVLPLVMWVSAVRCRPRDQPSGTSASRGVAYPKGSLPSITIDERSPLLASYLPIATRNENPESMQHLTC